MDEGACINKDPEIFFPTKVRQTGEAKKVCSTCDVRLKCLAWIMATERDADKRYGTYGGMDPVERKELFQKIKRLKEKDNG